MAFDVEKLLTYPYDNEMLLRKQKSLRRMLAERSEGLTEKRIAILGGSTTETIKNLLEVFLLHAGIMPRVYESEYNKYYEDAIFDNPELDAFRPEIVIVFTSVVNIIDMPTIEDDDSVVQKKLDRETQRFQEIWGSLERKYHAVIIQNNMDLPYEAPLGSLEDTASFGTYRFVEALNERFANCARNQENFYIHDLHGLSARIGLNRWHQRSQYYAYKFAMNYDVMPDVALGLAKIIRGILGKNKKCLVLDLDNTLWGGVIGDDGVNGIEIGHETPLAEAYTAFQEYVLKLKMRGVILAVCSKNEEDVARSGFNHPDSVLHVDDFVSFRANWEPKNINLAAIAKEINIGTDSLVFIDDNPAERLLVRATMPEVAVPEVDPTDVFSFIRALEGAGYFEPVTISEDDKKRNETYKENKERQALEKSVANYDEFLASLSMEAEIDEFRPVYFDRIAQLTNKTNQFNLTTRRYTRAEIEQIAQDGKYITLYGRLTDRFGDNGLISVVIGEKKEGKLHILLWLMSCRVLKRGMEHAMLDALAEKARTGGCQKLVGYYYPTKKNKMVADMYRDFGFSQQEDDGEGTAWEMDLARYEKKNQFINVQENWK